MGKAEENKRFKKSRLLDTAFELFTTKGIGQTSISDIADKANVGKGTFYLYFKNKRDLEIKLICHRAEALISHAYSGLLTLPEDTLMQDRVIFFVDDLIDQLCQNPILLKFIYKNLSWGLFRNAMNSFDNTDSYREPLRKMFGGNENLFQEVDLMNYTIIELVSSTCYNIILWNDPVDLPTYKKYLHKHIISILENHCTQEGLPE